MKTNDIKKGMVVELNNGWFGIMADNMKGNTRMVDVDGMYREIGSVYSHDIVNAWKVNWSLGSNIIKDELTKRIKIEHNKKQLDLKSLVASY